MNATTPTIHPTCIIDPSAEIHPSAQVGAFSIVGKGVKIGERTWIESGVTIYENVEIGANCNIGAQTILGEHLRGYRTEESYENPITKISANSNIRSGTIMYAGCAVGENFQTGHRAIIREYSIFGKDCSFGTLSQADGHIQVGDRCRFHNNVFIATYTTIENDCHFYPMSCTTDSLHPPCQKGRAGPYLEKGVIIGARVLLLPRVRIGTGAIVAGGSVVTADVPPNKVVAGAPAKILKNREEIRCHLEDRPAYEVALDSIGQT
jgi:acetyltransferase-like isoleucine patch superfamily enzyme